MTCECTADQVLASATPWLQLPTEAAYDWSPVSMYCRTSSRENLRGSVQYWSTMNSMDTLVSAPGAAWRADMPA